MAGSSIEDNRRRLAALQKKCVQLHHAKEMLLDEPVSPPAAKTLREHREEIQRLKAKKFANRAGWSPGQQARLVALVNNPRYLNEFWPLYLKWFSAEGEYIELLEEMERAGQVACSEVAPDSPKVDLKGGAVSEDERAGPNTVDFSENRPLLSRGAYSNDVNSHPSCSSVRHRILNLFNNGVAG